MENILGYVKIIIATVATSITWIIGTWDIALIALIVFMILDYLTGILKAFINREVSSNAGLRGIARKAVIFVVLIIAVLLDRLLNTGAFVFRTLVCYFYIANEGISILENCIELGVPVPKKLKSVLIQLKEGEVEDGDNEEAN